MASDFTKDELLIGKLKALTTDTETKALFDAYQLGSTTEQNIGYLGGSSSILQKTLLGAGKLLQSLKDDYPVLAERVSSLKGSNRTTKAQSATVIVQFIQDAREISCLKCNANYSPYSSSNSTSEVECFRCHRPGHQGCYTDSQIDKEAGVVYLCCECLSGERILPPVQLQPDHSKEPDNIPRPKDDTLSSGEPHAENPGNSKSGATDKEKKIHKDLEYDRSKVVCPLLLKQECPHGITGLTNGTCEHYHPTWCRKFMRNGPGGKRGCNRGDNCRYFHPSLCQNALVTKMCFNESCKLIHIRGVKRINDEKTSSKKQNPASRKQVHVGSKRKSENVQPSAPHDHPKRSKSVGESQTPATAGNPQKQVNSEDFLKHLEQMKADLTKEVTKDLSALIQSSLQSMLGVHQQQLDLNRQMYLPSPAQYSAPGVQNLPPLQGYPMQCLQQHNPFQQQTGISQSFPPSY